MKTGDNKINIAELLKDCPNGMELYSLTHGKCKLSRVCNRYGEICIEIIAGTDTFYYDKYGHDFYVHDGIVVHVNNGRAIIVPSEYTRDWRNFQQPFKDGDIVALENGTSIGITKGGNSCTFVPIYCVLRDGHFKAYFNEKETWRSTGRFQRLATEEEKEKLFNAINANGYKWNSETKTLEELTEPKFKDRDVSVCTNENCITPEIKKIMRQIWINA